MEWDRVKGAFFRAVRSADPRRDYYRLYRGVVVAQSPDLRQVDVVCDDPRLPATGLGGVPLRGIAGDRVDLRGANGRILPGTTVVVGWEDGDPSRVFAALWSLGVPTKRVIAADEVIVGGEDGAEPPVKASYLDAETTFLKALKVYATAIQAIADPTNAATPVLQAAIAKFQVDMLKAKATNATVK